MKRIPAFVRGMVVKAVEDSCRRNGIDRVTGEQFERIRGRMPTPKMFGQATASGTERGGRGPASGGSRGSSGGSAEFLRGDYCPDK